jgi:hypothetical protein
MRDFHFFPFWQYAAAKVCSIHLIFCGPSPQRATFLNPFAAQPTDGVCPFGVPSHSPAAASQSLSTAVIQIDDRFGCPAVMDPFGAPSISMFAPVAIPLPQSKPNSFCFPLNASTEADPFGSDAVNEEDPMNHNLTSIDIAMKLNAALNQRMALTETSTEV